MLEGVSTRETNFSFFFFLIFFRLLEAQSNVSLENWLNFICFFFLYWFDKLSFQFEILITLTAFLHSKRVQTCFSFKVTLSKRYVIFRSKWNILYIYIKPCFRVVSFATTFFWEMEVVELVSHGYIYKRINSISYVDHLVI